MHTHTHTHIYTTRKKKVRGGVSITSTQRIFSTYISHMRVYTSSTNKTKHTHRERMMMMMFPRVSGGECGTRARKDVGRGYGMYVFSVGRGGKMKRRRTLPALLEAQVRVFRNGRHRRVGARHERGHSHGNKCDTHHHSLHRATSLSLSLSLSGVLPSWIFDGPLSEVDTPSIIANIKNMENDDFAQFVSC